MAPIKIVGRMICLSLAPRRALLTGLVMALALPVLAQDGTGPVPQNAETRSFGGGWDCDVGYRVEGVECLAIDVPENAYATERSYGTGWACRRGYQVAGGTSCEPIPVPENAFLSESTNGWHCERGYRRERDACIVIVLPDHAYLAVDTTGSGWRCERGYEAQGNACLEINLPQNAHLDRTGNGWRCDRNFQLSGGSCVLGR